MKYLILLFISTAFAVDNRVDQCGHYEIEGQLVKKDNQYRFYASPKSESEVNIALGRKIPKDAIKFVKAHVIAEIEIRKPCRYNCIGRLHKIKGQVPPSRPLNIFKPEKSLIKKVKCSIK